MTPIPADQYCEATLPTVFVYPHCYEPRPIAALAADRLRKQLTSLDFLPQNDDEVGKMVGVLVVRHVHEKYDNNNMQLGYLKAYSGTFLPTGTMLPNEEEFCPLVYDEITENGFYERGEEESNDMNRMIIEQLEHDPELPRGKENPLQ